MLNCGNKIWAVLKKQIEAQSDAGTTRNLENNLSGLIKVSAGLKNMVMVNAHLLKMKAVDREYFRIKNSLDHY